MCVGGGGGGGSRPPPVGDAPDSNRFVFTVTAVCVWPYLARVPTYICFGLELKIFHSAKSLILTIQQMFLFTLFAENVTTQYLSH